MTNELRDVAHPGFFCEDSQGILGPPFKRESVGKRLQCFVQHSANSPNFVNPFDRKSIFVSHALSQSVFRGELHNIETGENRIFSFFSIARDGPVTTFFSAAKVFWPLTQEWRLKSNFFPKKDDECLVEVDHLEFNGQIVSFSLHSDVYSVHLCRNLFYSKDFTKHSDVVKIGDHISVAGYPCKIDDEVVANFYHNPDGSYGPVGDSLPKQDFIFVYQEIFGKDCIVIVRGDIRQDKSHAFYNANCGMIGGPVFVQKASEDDEEKGWVVGVHLGLDKTAGLHSIELFSY